MRYVLGTAIVLAAMPAEAGTVRREPAGRLADGTVIEAVTLTGANGVSARILSYGATLQSLRAPDRDGAVADVVLGYDDLAGYVADANYFGATVGRVANRVANGRFRLDGRSYQMAVADPPHALHGGPVGFSKRAWRIVSVEQGKSARVTLALTSPDGDQGYPGTVHATVSYKLDDAGALTIRFEAVTDRPTIVNMTNHAYFNLAGNGAALGVLDHRLTIPARAITPVDATLIPTGALRPVAGTAFDFRAGRRIGDHVRDGDDPQIVYARGYDHNFALDKGSTATPELAARLEDPASGRMLEVLTTEPGLQVYTANHLTGTVAGKGKRLYRMDDGVALEPQKFPDAANQPAFGSVRIDPGKPYAHVMVYRLSVMK